MALALLGACKNEASADGEGSAEQAPPSPPSERERQAQHLAAFEALVPLATEAMKLADPIAAAQLDLGPLRVSPTGLSEREVLRAANEKARLEAAEIDEAALEPKQRIGLRTMRFVTARIHDQLARQPPARNDPTFIPGEVSRVLDELELQTASGDCADCAPALDALVGPLRACPDELTAASDAGLAAAVDDLDRLVRRVEKLPARTADPETLAPAVERVVAQATKTRARLVEVRARLPATPTHAWIDRPPPRRAGAAVERLPDRLDARALIRRLEVEENLAVETKALIGGTKANLARFDAMHAELVGSAKASDRARPVTAERCQAAWEVLTETTLSQPGFEDAAIDCQALTRHLSGEPLDDADLLLRVVDRGVIDPVRRAFRRTQDPSIALATGQWTAASQRTLRRIMILGPTKEPVALGRAIDSGRDALCLTAAALWVHGELGEDAPLETWLGDACPAHEPKQWIAQALGHPRQSLTGLGIASVSDEPASMVGIDMFYWAPLGIIPLLATPPESLPPPDAEVGPRGPGDPSPGVEIKVEELGE